MGGVNPAAHLHASVGISVRATNGTSINDPDQAGCGFNGNPFTGVASPFGFPDAAVGASFDQLIGNLKVTIIPVGAAAVPGAQPPAVPPALSDRSVYTAGRDFTPSGGRTRGPWSGGSDDDALSDDPNGPRWPGSPEASPPILWIPYTPLVEAGPNNEEFQERLGELLQNWFFDREADSVDLEAALDEVFPNPSPEQQAEIDDLLEEVREGEFSEYVARELAYQEFLNHLLELERESAEEEFLDGLQDIVLAWFANPDKDSVDLEAEFDAAFPDATPEQREYLDDILEEVRDGEFVEYVDRELRIREFLEDLLDLDWDLAEEGPRDSESDLDFVLAEKGPRVPASDFVDGLEELNEAVAEEEFELDLKVIVYHFLVDESQLKDVVQGLYGLLPTIEEPELQGQLGTIAADLLDQIEDPEGNPEVAAEVQAHVDAARAHVAAGNIGAAFEELGEGAEAAEQLFGGPGLDEGMPDGLDADQLAADLQDAVQEGAESGMPERLEAADLQVVTPPKKPTVSSPPTTLSYAEQALGIVLRTYILALLPAITGQADVSFTLGGSGGGLAGVVAVEDGIKVKFTLTKGGMLEVEVEEKVLVGGEVSAERTFSGSVLGTEYGVGTKASVKGQGVFVNKQKYSFDPNKLEDVLALGILLAEGRVQFLGQLNIPILRQLPVLVSGIREFIVGPNTFLIEDRQAAGVKVAGGVKVESGPSLPKGVKVDLSLEGVVGIEKRPQAGQVALVLGATGEGAVRVPVPAGQVPILDFLNSGGAAGGEIRLVFDAKTGALVGVEVKFEVKGDVSLVENLQSSLGLPANLFGANELKSAEATIKGGGSIDVSIAIPAAQVAVAGARYQNGNISLTEFLAVTLADAGTKGAVKVKVKGGVTIEAGGEAKFAAGGGIGVKAKVSGTYEVTGTVIDQKPAK